MEQSNVKKYRFAPSPTGTLHMGSARTALFNYLLARHSNAKFILRIEDTDSTRSTLEFEENILDGLGWLGIEYDKFYRQSERKGIYQYYADYLESVDLAYKEDGAIKFRVTRESVTFHDSVRGEINFDMNLQEDFVIIKSDGNPSFHFANVVDDQDMEITHVIRGEDHISNTPKQLQIYNAFNWEPPIFGHISLILGMDKSKLSKRNGAKSISDFQAEGMLPEAVFNFLATLGWRPSKEIMSREELIQEYTINNVSISNSIFDPKKLEWINAKYIRSVPPKRLVEYMPPNGNTKLAKLIQPKLSNLNDIGFLVSFLNHHIPVEKPPAWFKEFVKLMKIGNYPDVKYLINSFSETRNIPHQEIFNRVRQSIAYGNSLPIFGIIEYLGNKEVIHRMEQWVISS